ncbi:unannotated protein [freshwater metagenome]|uniref:Unannotated protein n=1 Tax=freshwater metagenome TaxID=449393 RepID=A0A6J6J2A7_9ZZZZ
MSLNSASVEKGPDLNPFPGVMAFPIPIRSVVSGPNNFDNKTADVIAGRAHLIACCLPNVRGPTPTTTYEIATIKEIAPNKANALLEFCSTKKVATKAVAVSSQVFLTNRITFKNLAGFSTKFSKRFLYFGLDSTISSISRRERDVSADSLPAKNPATRRRKIISNRVPILI